MQGIGEIAGRHLSTRRAVWLSGRGRQPNALVWQPAPPATGQAASARRLAAGVLLFDGRLVETRAPSPWDVEAPDWVWADHLHGHAWMDDMAACPDPAVKETLRDWVWDWLDRFGDGTGPGWRPELVARRLTRWIAHSVDMLRGQSHERSDVFFRALGQQARFLSWRWSRTAPGIERIEALAGLVYASLSLEGSGAAAARAIAALGRAADETIEADGAVASRNPEELARIVVVLTWAGQAVEDAGQSLSPAHTAALLRGAAALRALRGGSAEGKGAMLARFHGGRAGLGLDLDKALRPLHSRLGAQSRRGTVMGYICLQAGESRCVIDAAAAPQGLRREGGSRTAHSSALALELHHGAQPIFVNCGSGQGFGTGLSRAARRRPSHSSIELSGTCPANLRPGTGVRPAALLRVGGKISGRSSTDEAGHWALIESSEYEALFGPLVERRVHLSRDGLRLAGEDTVLATHAASRARLNAAFPDDGPPCAVTVRFHLHPDVRPAFVQQGRAIALTLPDGTRWRMQMDADDVTLAPSQYFDETRPKPRATLQIVATAALVDYWGRISWSLERTGRGGTPDTGGDQGQQTSAPATPGVADRGPPETPE